MANKARGCGLVTADWALEALVQHPQQLDLARRRFSESPPSYTSHQSHNSTRSQSPDGPSEEQQHREELRWQLDREHRASLPYYQFAAQRKEERERIMKAHDERRCCVPTGTNFDALAHSIVKKLWFEQGIWNDKWNNMADGRWKHEEPFELESEIDSGAEVKPHEFSFSLDKAEAKLRQAKSKDETRLLQALRQHEREYSRPLHQFFYQLSKLRRQMQDESSTKALISISDDISTEAYKTTKNVWIKRGIWNREWGILPGMSWKHEQPIEEIVGDDLTPVEPSRKNDPPKAGEADPSQIFGRPYPVEPNYRQASGILNTSKQGLRGDIDSTREENARVMSYPSSSYSQRLTESSGKPRFAAEQRPRQAERKSSRADVQAQSISSKGHGHVHLSKVSKAPREKRLRPLLRNELSGPELPHQTAPRRSKRLHLQEPKHYQALTKAVPTDSLKMNPQRD